MYLGDIGAFARSKFSDRNLLNLSKNLIINHTGVCTDLFMHVFVCVYFRISVRSHVSS